MTTHEHHAKKTEKDVPSLFYENGKKYEITINLNDDLQYFDGGINKKTRDVRTRLEKVCKSFNSCVLKYLHDISTFSFIVEVSELQHGHKPYDGGYMKLPRIHFHGTITFSDCMTFLIERFKTIASISSIQLNDYRPKYCPYYIAKQSSLIEAYAKKRNVNTLFTEYKGQKKFDMYNWLQS